MKMEIYKKPMFGESVEIILDLEPVLAEEFVDIACKEGTRLSKIFNFYDESSELSELNKKRKLAVSDELLTVIKTALKYSEMTKGNYDITLGKNILKRKKGEELDKINCSYKDVKIKDNIISLNHPDILLDLGSIAKGYIVDKIGQYLIDEGILNGIVNGRGDLRVFGENPQTLGIQHPRDKECLIKKIKLKNKSVATSGDYNQFDNSPSNSHILNQNNLISITVVADDLMTADVFATVLFVVDKKAREDILKKNKNIQVLTIDKDLNLNYYNGFKELIVDNIEKNPIRKKQEEPLKQL
jgi:FAD:protein FMN transferase